MPTETGLSLFGVLKQADPALVDPGVTAQLECLLDDVVVGKQEMVGAIDAVCDVAERIIARLKESAAAGGPPLRGDVVGNGAAAYPPTPAMKRFAESLSRQKRIKPPPGYKTSISICRKFLSEHAPKKADGETAGKQEPGPVSPAQLLYAKKIAQGKRPRRGQGQLGCHVRVDRLEPGHKEPQERSQDRMQADGVNCASIGGADEEVSETQGRCRRSNSCSAESRNRHTPTNSLWKQGGRSGVRCSLPYRGMVCSAGS